MCNIGFGYWVWKPKLKLEYCDLAVGHITRVEAEPGQVTEVEGVEVQTLVYNIDFGYWLAGPKL